MPVYPGAPTRRSAPVPRIGTQPLTVSAARSSPYSPANTRPRTRNDRFSCSVQEPGSCSRPLHAGHRWASKQVPAQLIPGPPVIPGSDVAQSISTRQQGFGCTRLHDPHLTRSRRAFSVTLTTPALDRRSSRWFAAAACTATAEGRPPSLTQHRPATEKHLRFGRGSFRTHPGRDYFGNSSCISSFAFSVRSRASSVRSDSVSGFSAAGSHWGWIFFTHFLIDVSLISNFLATSPIVWPPSRINETASLLYSSVKLLRVEPICQSPVLRNCSNLVGCPPKRVRSSRAPARTRRNSSTTRNAPRSPARASPRGIRLASDGNRHCNIARATN